EGLLVGGHRVLVPQAEGQRALVAAAAAAGVAAAALAAGAAVTAARRGAGRRGAEQAGGGEGGEEGATLQHGRSFREVVFCPLSSAALVVGRCMTYRDGAGRGPQRSVASPTERVICFWKTIMRITSGSIASVVPAITRVQLLLYCDCSAEVATVITRHSGPEVITIGHMKLFQWVTTVISTSVTMIGRLSGTTKCHSRRRVPAPSIRIASMSSEGMPRKFSRSRKIA